MYGFQNSLLSLKCLILNKHKYRRCLVHQSVNGNLTYWLMLKSRATFISLLSCLFVIIVHSYSSFHLYTHAFVWFLLVGMFYQTAWMIHRKIRIILKIYSRIQDQSSYTYMEIQAQGTVAFLSISFDVGLFAYLFVVS